MKISNRSELPEAVHSSLPAHARDIYKAAFNSARQEYADPEDRRGNDNREEVAHKVAWSAVKQTYWKTPEGHWTKK